MSYSFFLLFLYNNIEFSFVDIGFISLFFPKSEPFSGLKSYNTNFIKYIIAEKNVKWGDTP
ncbi:hypothetical protein MTTB_p180 (plasmid) [Methanothermobacter tenebrarum]|uniref:Uncharacterized protein n=1 Tax=Methanothermobacter tenebrarum TaxID=680118 RepID=A0ABM7YFI3_9EURY|nr:hypothetical protein MTTB_p180 [Methanothermobacter tenebrarum]